MRSAREIAVTLGLCVLMIAAGCSSPLSDGLPEDPEDPGSLTLANNWNQDVEFTVFVDGERRAEFTVQPGETVTKPDFLNTTGQKNVTVTVVGIKTTFQPVMHRDNGKITGPYIEVEVTEDGTVIGYAD